MHTGHTIAVIAGGIDQPYPPENTDLHRRIAEAHLLVTEAPSAPSHRPATSLAAIASLPACRLVSWWSRRPCGPAA